MKHTFCITCGIEWSMPTSLYEQRIRDQDWFYCPNGHPQRFSGKNDEEKKREQAEALTQRFRDLYEAESGELERWKQAMRHCPICNERVSQARSIEIAAHRLSLHLQQIHHARGAVLALMPGETA